MPALTPEFLGSTIWIMLVAYVITLAYSIYMAIVNWKQAKVKDLVITTNTLLAKTNSLLEDINDKLDRKV